MASVAPSTLETVLDLSQIPAKELDRFIQDRLKPSPEFQKQMNKAIDAILSCIREKCVHKASRVSKVRRAGGDTRGPPQPGGPQWEGKQSQKGG